MYFIFFKDTRRSYIYKWELTLASWKERKEKLGLSVSKVNVNAGLELLKDGSGNGVLASTSHRDERVSSSK